MASRRQERKRTEKKGKAISMAIGATAIALTMFGVYFAVVEPAAKAERTDMIFRDAVKSKDIERFSDIVTLAGERPAKAEAVRLLQWFGLQDHLDKAIDEIAGDQREFRKGKPSNSKTDLFDVVEQDGTLWFETYQLDLKKQNLIIESDVPATVWVDGERNGTIDEEPLELELYPGEYSVLVRAEKDGKTGEVREAVQVGEKPSSKMTVSLEAQLAPDLVGQYDVDIRKVFEMEVKAQTGRSLDEMEDFVGEKRGDLEKAFGKSERKLEGYSQYEGMQVRYRKGRIQEIRIDLRKSESDLLALTGEPERRVERGGAVVWEYPSSFFEEVFDWFGFGVKKEVLEVDGRMWLSLS